MIRHSLCLLAAIAWQPGALAKNYLEDYLPESALLSISLRDTGVLKAAIEGGALSEMVPPEQKEEWLERLKEPFETSVGDKYILPSGEALSIATLSELFNGRACVSVISLDPENDMEPELVILADFAGDIDALKFLQTADREENAEKVLLIDEQYAGVTLYTEELTDLPEEDWMAEYWTLVDGIAVETSSMELLRNTVDAIIDARGAGLGDSPDFLRAVDLSPKSSMRAFFNLTAGVDLLQTAMGAEMDSMPINPLGVTMDSMWNSLKLQSLHAVFLSIDFESDTIESTFGVIYDQRDGLLSLLNYSQQPIHYPHWIPKDAVDSTVAMIDFPGVVASFEGLMNDMSPNFGTMFQLQLDNLKQQTGIDFRESLLNNFGDQFISFTVWDEVDEDDVAAIAKREKAVMAIPVRDPQALQNAIKGLTEVFLPGAQVLDEREFLGLTIVTPANHGMEEPPFAYALADGYLIFATGSVDLLERTLYNLLESNDGLWNQTYILDALDDLPPNPVESRYYNLGAAMEDVYEIYHDQFADEFSGKMGWQLPDISEFQMPYFMISTGYILEDAQITRARVLPKNP